MKTLTIILTFTMFFVAQLTIANNNFTIIKKQPNTELIWDAPNLKNWVKIMREYIQKQGLKKGIEELKVLKNNPDFSFSEKTLDELGYSLLNNGDTDEAIEIFQINQMEFPMSEITNASLASAYIVYGDRKNAQKYFDNTLIINPLNVQAKTLGNQKKGVITFRLRDYVDVKKVALVGNFNQYNNDKNLFHKTKNGDWECQISLPKGVFYYQFLIEDKTLINDPANKVSYKPLDDWNSVVVVH